MFRQDGRRVFERGATKRPARVSRTNPFPRPRPPFPAMEPPPSVCRTTTVPAAPPRFYKSAARFCLPVAYFVQDPVFPNAGAARFFRSEADSVLDYFHWSTAPPLYNAV